MTITSAGFIIANDAAIIATGATIADAIAAYNRDVGGILVTLEDGTRDYQPMTEDDFGGHDVRPATAALLAKIKDVGGDITWSVIDGVACVEGEQDDGWIVVGDGEIEVRIDFTHRERAVEWRMVGVDDSDPRAQWMGTPFQGAEFGLDADEAFRRVAAWLEDA